MNEIYVRIYTYGNKLYRNKLITNKKPGILVKTSLKANLTNLFLFSIEDFNLIPKNF